MLQPDNQASSAPQLYVVIVKEKPALLDRFGVVGTNQRLKSGECPSRPTL
jgi:hypothetical protein